MLKFAIIWPLRHTNKRYEKSQEPPQNWAIYSISGGENNDKSTFHLPRQCLRDGVKSLDFIGFLGWKRRIYTSFTPLEDRIGSQGVRKLQEI